MSPQVLGVLRFCPRGEGRVRAGIVVALARDRASWLTIRGWRVFTLPGTAVFCCPDEYILVDLLRQCHWYLHDTDIRAS